MGTSIDCEALLDQCWSLINKAYREKYGKAGVGYHKPEFRVVLSVEEIRALRGHVANLPSDRRTFIGIDDRTIFGHELLEQKRTPYIEAMMQ